MARELDAAGREAIRQRLAGYEGRGGLLSPRNLVQGEDGQFFVTTVDPETGEVKTTPLRIREGGGAEDGTGVSGGPPELNSLGRPARNTGLRGLAGASRTIPGMIASAVLPGAGVLGAFTRAGSLTNFSQTYGYESPGFGNIAASMLGADRRGEVSQKTTTSQGLATDVYNSAIANGLGPGAAQAAVDAAFISGDVGHPGIGRGGGAVDLGPNPTDRQRGAAAGRGENEGLGRGAGAEGMGRGNDPGGGAAGSPFHKGGMITDNDPSTYRENMPVVVQEGEMVMNRAATRKFKGLLQKMNRVQLNGRTA